MGLATMNGNYPPTISPTPPVLPSGYVTEDEASSYTTEDGTSSYVPES